jgi:regulator of replication initiation timing
MANNLNEQVEEVKKLHEKTLKKKTEQITREVEYMQTENKKLKLKNEQIEKSLNEL